MIFARALVVVPIFCVLLVGLDGCQKVKHSPQTVATNANPAAVVPTPTASPIPIGVWFDGITQVKGDTVYLNLGDRAGGLGSDDDSRLALSLLSYSIKAHPNASVFRVFYSYTVAMGTDEFELVYNRKQKTFGTKYGGRGKPVTFNKPPMRGIDDKAIHAAAKGYGSYHDIKRLSG